MLFFIIARPFLIFAPYVLNPPNPYSDCSMYTVKETKKNAVRIADTQMKEVLTKKFIPHAPLNSAGLFNWAYFTGTRPLMGGP